MEYVSACFTVSIEKWQNGISTVGNVNRSMFAFMHHRKFRLSFNSRI